MPIICRFLGIIIRMYFDDHAPPHFHASYGDYHIEVNIITRTVKGQFPVKQLKKLLEWASINNEALLLNWELVKNGKNPNQLDPPQ